INSASLAWSRGDSTKDGPKACSQSSGRESTITMRDFSCRPRRTPPISAPPRGKEKKASVTASRISSRTLGEYSIEKGHSGALHSAKASSDEGCIAGDSVPMIVSRGRLATLPYNKVVPKTKEVEARLQRTEQQLRVFQKVSRLMVRDLNLQEVLQGVVSLIVEFTQCDACLVYLLDNDELVLCASNTPHPSTIGKLRMRWSDGLTSWAPRERRLPAL